jgi:hypothetical protein
MPIKVLTSELPRKVRRSVAGAIEAALAGAHGDWTAALTSDETNNAWDVEVDGPGEFHWARRFSAGDRDADVIAAAITSAIGTSGQTLNEALSALASNGLAFVSEPGPAGEKQYIVDRVRLKATEIIYLYRQGALTAHGIRTYLLNRNVA